MNRMYVVLPCYNEESGIAKTIENWYGHADKLIMEYRITLRIVVVDDGSGDKTCEVVRGLQNCYQNIVLLQHGVNKGLGAAVSTGFEYVLSVCDPRDMVCVMDSDNTHDACYVYSMLDQMSRTPKDVMIASRYQPGSTVHGLSQAREVLSLCAGWYFSMLLKVPGVRDYTCGYRLYRCPVLRQLFGAYNHAPITQLGFTCMVEILYKIHRLGGRFGEVAFSLRYDLKEGQSKMKVLRTTLRSLLLPLRLIQSSFGAARTEGASLGPEAE